MSFWYKIIVALSLLLFLQIIAPFLKDGMFLGHDSQLHLIYLKKFEEALLAGQFPVRWIDWFFPGFNQPLFNFYQSGIYYFYLIPRFLGIPNVEALHITVVFLWLLSAILMFLFVKRHFGALSGLLGAYFYMVAPYHVLDLFIRAAMPEFTALTFVPGIFWGIKGFFDTRKGIFMFLTSLFIALVLASHPPTFIMISAFVAPYIIYLFWLEKSYQFLKSILFSVFVGFGLVSFFILPAFFEQDFVQIIFMRSGYYDFRNHFVCLHQLFSTFWAHGTSQYGCQDGLSLQLGLAHWLGILLVIFILISRFLIKKYKAFLSSIIDLNLLKPKDYLLLAITLTVFFIYIYITLEISQPLWETLPYIPFIQYSWRFLSVATFISSFLAASVLLVFKKEQFRLGAFVFMMLLATFLYGSYLKPIAYAQKNEINFGKEVLVDALIGFKILDPEPGYMPKWTQVLPAEDDRPLEEVKFFDPQGLGVATDSAQVNDFKLSAHKKDYQITVQKPTVARFYTHYFPGWKVLINNKEVKPNYENIYGYMDVPLATGQNQVRLILENTFVRSLGNNLSISFLVVALSFMVFYRKSKE